jgi:hypothetical protein
VGSGIAAQYQSGRGERPKVQNIDNQSADERGICSGRSKHPIFDDVGCDEPNQNDQHRKSRADDAETPM